MKSSRVLLSLGASALLSVLAGCSHQAPPVGSAATAGVVAHPTIGFALKGPPAADAPVDPERTDRQDAPIVDALHGWSHSSPR
jgi:hypothetical protein